MSYRLIDANALAMDYKEVNDMPCIYADLPNGLDDGYYDLARAERTCHPVIAITEDGGYEYALCSECDGRIEPEDNYCPNFGARVAKTTTTTTTTSAAGWQIISQRCYKCAHCEFAYGMHVCRCVSRTVANSVHGDTCVSYLEVER